MILWDFLKFLIFFKYDSTKPNYVLVKATLSAEYVEIKLNNATDIQSFPDEVAVLKIPIERRKY